MSCHGCNGNFYFNYKKNIETFHNLSLRSTNKFACETFSSSWLFCKDLVGHYGCVNAIEFSNKGGEYLVSGGDDSRVLVWRLSEAVHQTTTPRCMETKHLSNIFCASFDSENRHIISAGNDDQVLIHNFETGELIRSLAANDATYDVCIHPENDNIFITAGEHGDIDLYDLRLPADKVKLASGPPIFHSAIFNPVDPAIFVTASAVRGVQLWDARVPLSCLKRFDKNAGVQCAMGVAFDNTGRHIAAVRRKLPPVLYHIERNTSLVEFHEENYCNSCTMKSVCFGGEKDNFLISGSDDFNVYVWEIPMVDKNCEGILNVEKSFLSLNGHRSIVNQVCFNKATSMLCSAGVEKIIKMWSPFPMTGCKDGSAFSEGQPRTPYSQLDYARMIIESGRPLSHDYDDQSTSEDPRMIAFFDSLVQREQDSSSTDSSSDEDDVAPRYIDVLRRMRAIFFEQLRNEREQLSSSGDESPVEDSNSSHDISPQRNEPTEDSGTQEETRQDGVDLGRLREIISTQQNTTTNTRKRIAELRRNCLKNDENTTTGSLSSEEKCASTSACTFGNSFKSFASNSSNSSCTISSNFLNSSNVPISDPSDNCTGISSEGCSNDVENFLRNYSSDKSKTDNSSISSTDSSSNSDESETEISETCEVDKRYHNK